MLQKTVEGEIFTIPWGHHKLLLDKVKGDLNKALFYICQTEENGWSRTMLQGWIETDLYERSGKALTNFSKSMPDVSSALAQELTRDPYSFAFTGITKKYNEAKLKEALTRRHLNLSGYEHYRNFSGFRFTE